MTYFDLLAGSARTNAPIVKVATVDNESDGRRIAAARARHDDDGADFREIRSIMHNRTGVCG